MDQPGTTSSPGRARFLVLAAPTLLALFFLYSHALQYLSMGHERLGIFWPIRRWLHIHLAGGIFALLSGPIQFWLGRNRHHPLLHRLIGIAYVVSVACSSVAAIYLALHTGFGWVYGMGFVAMAVAWITSTGLATIAICRHMIPQHREWMVRSYIVTFGFVTHRMLLELFKVIDVGTTVEQLSAASWACWSIPLLIGEGVLQGRKIFSTEKTVNTVTPKKHAA